MSRCWSNTLLLGCGLLLLVLISTREPTPTSVAQLSRPDDAKALDAGSGELAPLEQRVGDQEHRVREPMSASKTKRSALRLFGEKGPPDRIETGNGAIRVRVINRASGQLASGRVDLWRIGAPANDAWSLGDQWQRKAQLAQGRAQFDDLAPGHYRVFLPDSTPDSVEPEAFEVFDGVRELNIAADFPRQFPCYVNVVRSNGSRVESVRIDLTALGGSREDLRPSWLRPRRHLHLTELRTYGSIAGSSSRQPIRDPELTEKGFLIGELSEPSRSANASWRLRVRADGLVAEGVIRGGDAVNQTVTAVLVDPIEVAGSFLDETGMALDDVAAHLSVRGGIVISNLPAPWLEATFDIKVSHTDFEPYSGQWSPADGALEKTVLTKRNQDL